MTLNLQPDMHPDADQLSIFVEGAASGRERERMLAHLAECEECRDAVFLMQPREELKSVTVATRKWTGQRWLVPAGLAGAVFACGLMVVLVFLEMHRRAPEQGPQVAGVQTPQSQAADPVPVQPVKQKGALGTGAVAPTVLPRAKRDTNRLGAPHKESQAEFAAAAPVAGSSDSVAHSAAPAAIPAPATPPINSISAAQLPLNGRNLDNLQSLAAPPQENLSAKSNPVLKIEGMENGTLSGISGHVTDASGAVIPKATVALHNAAGTTQQTTTGADGSFQLTGMAAGHYDLTVTAPGFQRSQQSIDLKLSELAMLQPVLAVGAATQTVEVTSSAPLLETESASVASIATELPSRLPVASSVSLGKRILSLDRAGSLFLSRNKGKSWKKVQPQWAGIAVRIELAPADERAAKHKSEASGTENASSVFQLTTDGDAAWTSKDGTHWRPQ